MKGIVATDWDGAADIDALRRNVMNQHGALLVELVAERKISCTSAAALARLHPSQFSEVRRDFARGQTARHCEAPPVGEERRRQEDIVVRSAAASEEGERYGDFVARLGAGITLGHNRIRVLRQAVLQARAATPSGI